MQVGSPGLPYKSLWSVKSLGKITSWRSLNHPSGQNFPNFQVIQTLCAGIFLPLLRCALPNLTSQTRLSCRNAILQHVLNVWSGTDVLACQWYPRSWPKHLRWCPFQFQIDTAISHDIPDVSFFTCEGYGLQQHLRLNISNHTAVFRKNPIIGIRPCTCVNLSWDFFFFNLLIFQPAG